MLSYVRYIPVIYPQNNPNRQRRKEGTFSASELAGIEPTPPAPKGAGYVHLDRSATASINLSRLGGWLEG